MAPVAVFNKDRPNFGFKKVQFVLVAGRAAMAERPQDKAASQTNVTKKLELHGSANKNERMHGRAKSQSAGGSAGRKDERCRHPTVRSPGVGVDVVIVRVVFRFRFSITDWRGA